MKINKALVCLLAISFTIGSCQKEYEVETIENYEMSGQWYVQTYYGGTTADDVVLGYEEIVTSNTSKADGTELLVDDKGNIWPFKVKTNVSGMSFSASDVINLSDDEVTVSITNGKIIANGGKSIETRTTVDSIYFEAEFSDDPGSTYIIAGHYKTGFEEDQP